MPLRSCDFPACSKPVERDLGNCIICSSHCCFEHLAPEFHSCPSEETNPDDFRRQYDFAMRRHLSALLTRVNFVALASTASRLRDGIPCRIPAASPDPELPHDPFNLGLVASQMGGQNCHVDIHFEDGKVWIARLRLDEPNLPPSATQKAIFSSEIATLHFLQNTTVPSPRVYYHAFEGSDVGTPFVLMEKMPGAALEWDTASPQQRTKVMEQLARIFLELERHPFPSMGSLSDEDGTVGAYAQSHLFAGPSESLGPFQDPETALVSMIRHELKLIESGELSALAEDNALTHRWRLAQIPSILKDAQTRPFYLKHNDDKGDHILVDDQHNITAIIDWEFASTECKHLAFSSPCMMWPVERFYDGSNDLSAEETEFAQIFRDLGRADMAQMVAGGRKHQRFLFYLGALGSTDQDEFEALFQGLRASVQGPDINSYGEWKKAMMGQSPDT